MNINDKNLNRQYAMTHVFFIISLFFASFDIALIIELGGVSFRISQVFQFILILSGILFTAVSRRNYVMPLAYNWLMLWGLFLLIWTGNTYHIEYSVGQTLFFIFTCVLYFSVCQVYSARPDKVKGLFKAYIISFVSIAVFGLIQFLFGIIGVDLLVEQWWIKGVLPRINGFSFEPSYFATYLISGWGILVWLIERRVHIFSKRTTYAFFTIITTAIVLSSSRMAWLILATYGAFYVVRNILNIVRTREISRDFIVVGIFIMAATMILPVISRAQINWAQFKFLLFGTGLFGTASGSSTIRLGTLQQTIDLFWASPVVGYGIGGVASYISVQTGLPPGEATGMNVTLEVLVASGIIGFVFFVLFLWTVFSACFPRGKNRTMAHECLASLGVGLALLFIILQFNQSIMRLYFWNNVFMIGVFYQAVHQTGKYRVNQVMLNRRSKRTAWDYSRISAQS